MPCKANAKRSIRSPLPPSAELKVNELIGMLRAKVYKLSFQQHFSFLCSSLAPRLGSAARAFFGSLRGACGAEFFESEIPHSAFFPLRLALHSPERRHSAHCH